MNKKIILSFFILVILLVGALLSYFYFHQKTVRVVEKEGLVPEYRGTYELVGDKISGGANIVINLPPDTTQEEVREKIVFVPEIKGQWLDSGDEKKLLFDPEEKLEKGKYYTVILETVRGNIGKDFLIDEDPEIVAVFPRENSETNEKSDITIIFNRPMVPLTTLDVNYENDIPVEIVPITPGKFKWISTKTLQFQPEETLIPSSNYKVSIKPGFISMDGLEVNVKDHNFQTRKLRYENVSMGEMVYNQPIYVKFNQDVDLDKTGSEIKLFRGDERKQIAFIAEYGTIKKYNPLKKESDEIEDRSTILIFNEEDRYGREKLWNFKERYSFEINKAFPIKGDIIIDQKREEQIQVLDVIQGMNATSEKTNFASPDFFDAYGKLWIAFYEEIDLDKSSIEADYLDQIGYGEKCAESDNENYRTDIENCDKVPDKNKIYMSFQSSKIKYEDKLEIRFKKIVNMEGLKINEEAIVRHVTVIPKFKIKYTVPNNDSGGASLQKFSICSNSPIIAQEKDDIDEYLRVSPEYEFVSWNKAYLVTENNKKSSWQCKPGEFESVINYGLMPNMNYTINIKAIDHFGNEDEATVRFKAGEMPEKYLNFFHFQPYYTVTVPDKTKLTYAGFNMEYVDLHICKLAPSDMMYYLENKPNYDEPASVVTACKEVKTDKIELAKRYWIKNYFQIRLSDYFDDTRGYYILTFSNSNYKHRYKKEELVHERTYISVTNLNVIEKKVNIKEVSQRNEDMYLNKDQKDQANNLYLVSKSVSLEPVKDAKIDIYQKINNKITYLDSVNTDKDGVAKTKAYNDVLGAIVSLGGDSAIVSSNQNYLNYGSTAYNARKMYLYADRPIYRPGHEVNVKGVYRIGYDGEYEIFNEEKVFVKILNSKREEIFNDEVEVNDFGTLEFKIKLDVKAPLGRYRIEALNNYFYFDVEEYVPAAFKVETSVDQEEYIAGDTFNLNVNADYYFGVPLDGGTVTYSIGTQNYYFDKYKGEYFPFGNSRRWCYWDCGYQDKFILRNKVDINKNGQAQISHKLDFSKWFSEDEQDSRIVVVYMTVNNENGQSVSTQKSFIVHAADIYLGVKTDKSFLGKDEQFNIKVKSVNKDGQEVGVQNIDMFINKIEWIKNKRKEVDGGYYYRWEEKLTPVITKKLQTDTDGNWNEYFSLSEEGEYRIKISGRDMKGNIASSRYDIYVYGKKRTDIRPSNDDKLELVTETSNVNVGDTASFIIKSPYEKAKALVTIERGKIFDYKVFDVNQSLYKYNFSIEEEYIPNIYASVVLFSADPDVKYGQINYQVNTLEKELDVVLKTNKKEYLPGEEVDVEIEVKDSLGRGAETELSIAVADLSVLALKGNPKKNPVRFFYGGLPLTITTSANLKRVLEEMELERQDLFSESTKGGGGAEADDLAKKKRGIFKDTAYWQAVVKTDDNGKAKLKFTLPDNLTTWQIESLALTKDTKLGVDYQEITSRKSLMVTPLKPRFVIPGDEFAIGAKIYNQTDKDMVINVKISSPSLELGENNIKTISIKSKDSSLVYFNTLAPSNMKNGEHRFVIEARSSDYEDTVENTITIKRNNTYEASATSGYTKNDRAVEYMFLPDNIVQDMGDLTIKTSATLALFLSDALNYMLSFPYGCSEQIASKLSTIAVIRRGLDIENIGDKFDIKDVVYNEKTYSMDELVDIGLTSIYQNQQSDGGFAYYQHGQPSLYLTMHIVDTFYDLRLAGYNVDKERLRRALVYLNNFKWQWNNDMADYTIISLAHILSKFKDIQSVPYDLNEKVKNIIRNNDQYVLEKISNNTLLDLAALIAENQDMFTEDDKTKIYNTLENRIQIDSRGSYLPTNNNILWHYYETPIKNTAMLLDALIVDKRDNAILGNILRWLLRSRSKDGAWGSTNNTLHVVKAFVNYLNWQQENKSDFELKISLDGKVLDTFSYSSENILEQNTIVEAISGMNFNTMTPLVFEKKNRNKLNNNFYYDVSLKYYLPISVIPPRDEGFTIKREFYALDDEDRKYPVTVAGVGDVLRGHIKIYSPMPRNLVAIEDFIPAGVELVNFNLATENKEALLGEKDNNSNKNYFYYDGSYESWRRSRTIYPDQTEMYDDRLFLFKEQLPAGVYEYEYYVRVLIPGKFYHLPAVISEMYFPENFGRTRGGEFKVDGP